MDGSQIIFLASWGILVHPAWAQLPSSILHLSACLGWRFCNCGFSFPPYQPTQGLEGIACCVLHAREGAGMLQPLFSQALGASGRVKIVNHIRGVFREMRAMVAWAVHPYS